MQACFCLLFCADVVAHMLQLQIQSCKMFRFFFFLVKFFFFFLQVKPQLGFDLALKHCLYNETVASVLLQLFKKRSHFKSCFSSREKL